MILHVDPASPVPPYEQLRGQVTTMTATGVLPAGTRLPAIRQLARDLGLASGTVSRAYRELERDGVIVSRGRHGTFVLDTPRSVPAVDTEQGLAAAARQFAVHVRQLGVDAGRALRQAQQALDELVPH